jgi:hypothetical protein
VRLQNNGEVEPKSKRDVGQPLLNVTYFPLNIRNGAGIIDRDYINISSNAHEIFLTVQLKRSKNSGE